MKRLSVALLFAAGLCLAQGAARGDVTIEMKHNGEPQEVFLAEHMFSASTHDGGMIFRGDKKLLWAIDTKDKKYSEITEEDAKALGAKVTEAMAQMQEAMKNVPPEQRAMMEKMLAGKMPGMKETKRTVKPLGQSKEVNGFACAGYVVTTDDGSTTEIWAADPKAIHLEIKEIAVFKEFADFMKTMLPGLDQFKDMIKDYEHPREDEVPGFPVLTIHKDKNGKEDWRTELVKIDSGAVAAEKFEVPSGFKKEKAAFGN